MDERATGIILRTRPLTETSLVVHWLTPDAGRLATVAKGAHRPKSPFRGKLDLFFEADLSFARSRRSDLHTLREVSLRETHSALRQDLGRLQQAAYCAALVEQTTETDTPLPGIYSLFHELLAHLAATTPRPRTVLAFEVKLLRELGLAPDAGGGQLGPEARALLSAMAEADWPALAALQPGRETAEQLRRFLQGFLVYHLGRIPAGRAAALGGEA